MNIGFTGTREGMTEPQSDALYTWVEDFGWWDEFHHGACVGADYEASVVFFQLRQNRPSQEIHAHPSNLRAMTHRFSVDSADVRHPPKPPLNRNRDIVDCCDILLACPKGPEEQRSGTWATIRYARKQRKRVVIFWPDGSITE